MSSKCVDCVRKNKLLFEASLHYGTVERQNAMLIEIVDKKEAENFQLRKMLRGLLQSEREPTPGEMRTANLK